MKVTLISSSKPADGKDQNLLDIVSYCARVSNPANQNNTDTNEKLVRYLMKHNHWSPFEMVSICLEIETTRDIGFEWKDARLQDTKNRQNSIETDDEKLQNDWVMKQRMLVEASKDAYDWAIKNGIAKEQARAVLPEGNTVTRMYMNGTLRSWIHYIQLRSGNGTQKEHRDVAIACADAIEPIFPMIREFISV